MSSASLFSVLNIAKVTVIFIHEGGGGGGGGKQI
jgi:hypothetical protein